MKSNEFRSKISTFSTYSTPKLFFEVNFYDIMTFFFIYIYFVCLVITSIKNIILFLTFSSKTVYKIIFIRPSCKSSKISALICLFTTFLNE